MNKLLFLFLAFSPLAARAQTYHATPFTSAFLVDALLKAGAKLDRSKPTYVITLNDFACDYRENEEDPKSPGYSLWDYSCRSPKVSGAAAQLLYQAFDKLEYQEKGNPSFGDCGMGRCEIDVKSIRCTINSAEPDHSQRFACALDDGINEPKELQ